MVVLGRNLKGIDGVTGFVHHNRQIDAHKPIVKRGAEETARKCGRLSVPRRDRDSNAMADLSASAKFAESFIVSKREPRSDIKTGGGIKDKSTSSMTMPDGQKVHILKRELFDKAIDAAKKRHTE